jgi:hypothetical protein
VAERTTLEAEAEALVAAALGELEQDTELAALVATAAEEGRLHFGRVCPTCGSEFVPRRSHGVYCKTSCRVLAWQGRQASAT